MNKDLFFKEIEKKFRSFGVDDSYLLDSANYILPIDSEPGIPAYKIVISMLDEDYLTVYACFKHDAILKKEVSELCQVLNHFNQESFLTFTAEKEVVKITYPMPEIDESDVLRVVKISTLMPTLIAEFYPDLKKYLK